MNALRKGYSRVLARLCKCMLLLTAMVATVLQAQTHKDMTDGMMTIRVEAGGKTFVAYIEDNETGRAFAARLPLTLDMTELNGNEKYCYLDSSLPTSAYAPETIEAGDIMLYGSSCVVMFYETFRTSYSYTRIGRISPADGLRAALGQGSVTVKFGQGIASGTETTTESGGKRSENYTPLGQRVGENYRGITVSREGKRLNR